MDWANIPDSVDDDSQPSEDPGGSVGGASAVDAPTSSSVTVETVEDDELDDEHQTDGDDGPEIEDDPGEADINDHHVRRRSMRKKESRPQHEQLGDNPWRMPTFDPSEMVGRTFLSPPKPDGSIERVEIVEALEEFDRNRRGSPEVQKFRCKHPDSKVEEIYEYNELCDMVEDSMDLEGKWNFERFIDLKVYTKNKKVYGKVLVQWGTGERTWVNAAELDADGYGAMIALLAKDSGPTTAAARPEREKMPKKRPKS